jgi:hypothetical protein
LWNAAEQGGFITSVLRDTSGELWVATEDKGVWRRHENRWTNYSVAELGDDTVFSLATDRKGRVWAGTLKSGFAVWNGEVWKRYPPLEAGIGERVFDIALCARDGAMWIAHSAGLSRIEENGVWTNFSREENCPADAMSALAFDAEGNLVAGTQAEGIALARREGGYKTWKLVRAVAELPASASGNGLPSDLINDVLVGRGGRMYAATTRGVAWSDDGQMWGFDRGSDWVEKHKLHPNKPALPADAAAQTLLAEDYATTLAQSSDGKIWIGFRRKGYAVIDAENNELSYSESGDGVAGAETISSIFAGDGPAVIGTYGAGVVQSMRENLGAKAPEGIVEIDRTFPALPPMATAAELDSWREKITNARQMPWGEARALPDDWATQGNWVGRYGENALKLCGVVIGTDAWHSHYKYGTRISTGPTEGANVYSFTQWLQSDLRRVLFLPKTGGRRQSELNDGSWQGAKFPLAMTGPNLWVRFDVPTGIHRAAFYFFNKDGHSDANRWRDYELELKPWRETWAEVEAAPTLARGRVQNFWGGVYKNFAVVGPGSFYLKVGRNHSHVTIIQGVFLDRWSGNTPEGATASNEWLKGIEPTFPAVPTLSENAHPTLRAADNLWTALDANIASGEALTNRAMRLAAYRAAAANGATPELLAAWRRKMGAWLPEDDAEWNAWQKQAQTARAVKE